LVLFATKYGTINSLAPLPILDMKHFIEKLLGLKIWGILVAVFILVLCTVPTRKYIEDLSFSDKYLHIAAFTALSFFWFFQVKVKYKLILFSLLYGIFIECWQWILPKSFERSFEWMDMVADAAGTILGLLLAYGLRKLLND
jgi:VanZ family protein